VFIPAIILALVIFILKRDWRFGALLLVFAAGYLPWFLYPNRTMFFFYALNLNLNRFGLMRLLTPRS